MYRSYSPYLPPVVNNQGIPNYYNGYMNQQPHPIPNQLNVTVAARTAEESQHSAANGLNYHNAYNTMDRYPLQSFTGNAMPSFSSINHAGDGSIQQQTSPELIGASSSSNRHFLNVGENTRQCSSELNAAPSQQSTHFLSGDTATVATSPHTTTNSALQDGSLKIASAYPKINNGEASAFQKTNNGELSLNVTTASRQQRTTPSPTAATASGGEEVESPPLQRNPSKAKTKDKTPKSKTDDSKEKPGKPSKNYIAMISAAILASPRRLLQLHEIYEYLERMYPYFKQVKSESWKNTVRHNLSLNECFIKAGRSDNGKGHYWSIHEACIQDFLKGDFRRRQARQQAKRGSFKQVASISTVLHPAYTSYHDHAGANRTFENNYNNYGSSANSSFSGQNHANNTTTANSRLLGINHPINQAHSGVSGQNYNLVTAGSSYQLNRDTEPVLQNLESLDKLTRYQNYDYSNLSHFS